MLFEGQVAAAAVGGVLGPGPGGVPRGHDRPAQFPPSGGERLAGGGCRACGEPFRCGMPPVLGGPDENGEDRKPFAGPLVHPGLAPGQLFGVRDLLWPDRARCRPLRPPGRVIDGPLGDVEVERADCEQGVGRCGPGGFRPARGPSRRLAGDPVFPAGHLRRGQAQRADAGMMQFQVAPEQPAQDVGDRPQGRVVGGEVPFPEVAHQQVPDGDALDAVLDDQLVRGELAAGGEHPDAGRGLGREHPGCPQQLVEVHSRASGLSLDRPRRGGQLQAVPGGDVADQAAFGGHDRCDTAERQVPGQRADLLGLACPAERREGTGVTGPGHLAGEQLQARAGQQPSRVRPDQVPADHQEQPGSQAAAQGAAGGCPARRGNPPGGDLAPAGAGLASAGGRPAFLPRAAGLPAEPVQDLPEDPPPLLLAAPAAEPEWRGRQQRPCFFPAYCGPRPPAGAFPGRELPHHLRAVRGGGAGTDPGEQGRRCQPGRSGGAHKAVPNRTCKVSGR